MANTKNAIYNKAVPQYIKNVGKSTYYSTVDTLRDIAPASSEFVTQNSELLKQLTDDIRNYKSVFKTTMKNVSSSNLMKSLGKLKDNILEDAKTGNFYNKDRQQSYVEDSNSELFDTSMFDESNFQFDDSEDTSSKPNLSIQAINDVGNKTSAVFAKSTSAVATATANSANFIAENARTLHVENMVTNYKMFDQINTHLTKIDDNVQGLFDYTNNITKHYKSTADYYDKSIEMLNKIEALNKEYTEMYRYWYRDILPKDSKPKYDAEAEVFGAEGSLNIKAYADHVKKKTKEKFDSTFGGSMNLMGDNPLEYLFASPLQFITDAFSKKFISTNIKKSMEKLDVTVGNLPKAAMLKLNHKANTSDNELFGLLNDILGVAPKFHGLTKTNAYEKGPVPYNGLADKAITDVIPTYLRKILSAITNQQEMIYNYEDGNFTDKKSAKEKYDRLVDNSYSGMNSFADSLKQNLNNFFIQSQEDRETLEEDRKTFIKFLADNSYFYDPHSKEDQYNDMFTNGLNLKGGRDSYKLLTAASKAMSKEDVIRLTTQTYNTNRERSDFNDDLNSKLTRLGLTGLFDKSKVDDGYNKNGVGPIFNEDKYGMSAIDYLRDIRQILLEGIITTSIGNIKGSMPGLNNRLSKYHLSIKNNHDKEETIISDEEAKQTAMNNNQKHIGSFADLDNYSDSQLTNYMIQGNLYSSGKDVGSVDARKLMKERKSLTGRALKNSNMYDSVMSLRRNIDRIISSPSTFVSGLIDDTNNNLYSMLYGNGNINDKSFLGGLMTTMKSKFDEFSTWMSNKILDPLNEKLFGKEGIVTKMESKARKIFDKYSDKALNYLLGYKDKDGKRNGGVLSKFSNSVSDSLHGAANLLYGKEYTSKTTGELVGKRNKTVVSETKQMVSSVKSELQNFFFGKEKKIINDDGEEVYVRNEGLVGGVKKFFKSSLNKANKKLFGEDGNVKDIFNKHVKPALPSSIAGAGLGMLAAPLVPGLGLVSGLLVGSGLGFVKSSESAKKYLFGDLVNGERAGGKLMSAKTIKMIKDHAPSTIAGNLLGAGVGLFTGMPIWLTGFLGSSIGFAKSSEGFKDWLFGQRDKDGNRDKSKAIISEASLKYMKKVLPAGVLGIVGGKFLHSVVTAKLGVLGSFLMPGGPLGTALAGLTVGIISQTETFKKWLFGEKDPLTDKRSGGFFGQVKNWITFNILNPLKVGVKSGVERMRHFFVKAVKNPIMEAVAPIKKQFSLIGQSIKETLQNTIGKVFENSVGKPFGKFMKDNILNPLKGFFGGILRGMGKVAGSIISAPAKMINGVGMSLMKKHKKKGVADYEDQWLKDKKERDTTEENKHRSRMGEIEKQRNIYDSAQEYAEHGNYREESLKTKAAKRYLNKKKSEGKLDMTFEQAQKESNKELAKLSGDAKVQTEQLNSIDNVLINTKGIIDKGINKTNELLNKIFGAVSGKFSNSKGKPKFTVKVPTGELDENGEAIKKQVNLFSVFKKKKDDEESEHSHASGLDKVPFDNYKATLHKGEMVLPARASNILRKLTGEQTADESNVRGNVNSKNGFVNNRLFKSLFTPVNRMIPLLETNNSLTLSIDNKLSYILNNLKSSSRNKSNDNVMNKDIKKGSYQFQILDNSNIIRKDVKDIRKEVHGQLDGLGYNVEKITNILIDQFGEPSLLPTGLRGKRGNKAGKGIFGRIFSSIESFISDRLSFVKNLFMGPIRAVKGFVKSIVEIPKHIISLAKTTISGVFTVGKEAVKGFAGVLKDTGKFIFDTTHQFIKVVGSTISSTMKVIGKTITTAISSIAPIIKGVATGVGSIIGQLGKSVSGVIKGMTKLGESLAKFTFDLIPKFFGGVKKVLGFGKNIIKGALGAILSPFLPEKNSVQKVFVQGGTVDVVKKVISIGKSNNDIETNNSDSSDKSNKVIPVDFDNKNKSNNITDAPKPKKDIRYLAKQKKEALQESIKDKYYKLSTKASEGAINHYKFFLSKFGKEGLFGKLASLSILFLPKLIKFGKTIWNFVKHPWKSLFGLIKKSKVKIAKFFIDTIGKSFGKLFEKLFGKGVKGKMGQIGDKIKKKFSGTNEKVKDKFGNAKDKIKNKFKKDPNKTPFKDKIKNGFGNLSDKFKNGKSSFSDKIKSGLDSFKSKDKKSLFKNMAGTGAKGLGKGIKGAGKGILKGAGKVGKGALGLVGGALSLFGGGSSDSQQGPLDLSNMQFDNMVNLNGTTLLYAPNLQLAGNGLGGFGGSGTTDLVTDYLKDKAENKLLNKGEKSLAKNALKGGEELIGKNLLEDGTKSLTKNVIKAGERGASKNLLGKGAAIGANMLADEATKSPGMIGKAKSFFGGAVEKAKSVGKSASEMVSTILDSSIAKKAFGKFTNVIGPAKDFVMKAINKLAPGALAKVTAKLTTKAASVAAAGSATFGIGTAVLYGLDASMSVAAGAFEAREILQVPANSSITLGMRTAVAIAKFIDLNLTFGFVDLTEIATFIYGLVASDEDMKTLTTNQQAMQAEYNEKVQNGDTDLSFNDYNKQQNQSSISKAWDNTKSAVSSAASSAWDGIKSAGSAAWNGIKGAGSAVKNFFFGNGPDESSGGETTNSGDQANGMVYFSQSDPRWGQTPYGPPDSRTIGSSGCGPTSAAMVLSSLTGRMITPVETAKYAQDHGHRIYDQGTSWGFFNDIGTQYGVSFETAGTDSEKIKSALRERRPVILTGRGPKPFTRGGHFVVAAGVSGDGSKIIINDPVSKERSVEYPFSEVIGSAQNSFIAGKALNGQLPSGAAGGANAQGQAKKENDPLMQLLEATTGYVGNTIMGKEFTYDPDKNEQEIAGGVNGSGAYGGTMGTGQLSQGVLQYDSVFRSVGAQYGVEPEVMEAIAMQESGGNANLKEAAWGLMQIENGDTTQEFINFGRSIGQSFSSEDRCDPNKAIPFATKRVSDDLKHYSGDYLKSIQAYNFSRYSLDALLKHFPNDWQAHTGEVGQYNGTGLSSYGDKDYIPHVMRYYKGTAIKGGGGNGLGPEDIKKDKNPLAQLAMNNPGLMKFIPGGNGEDTTKVSKPDNIYDMMKKNFMNKLNPEVAKRLSKLSYDPDTGIWDDKSYGLRDADGEVIEDLYDQKIRKEKQDSKRLWDDGSYGLRNDKGKLIEDLLPEFMRKQRQEAKYRKKKRKAWDDGSYGLRDQNGNLMEDMLPEDMRRKLQEEKYNKIIKAKTNNGNGFVDDDLKDTPVKVVDTPKPKVVDTKQMDDFIENNNRIFTNKVSDTLTVDKLVKEDLKVFDNMVELLQRIADNTDSIKENVKNIENKTTGLVDVEGHNKNLNKEEIHEYSSDKKQRKISTNPFSQVANDSSGAQYVSQGYDSAKRLALGTLR